MNYLKFILSFQFYITIVFFTNSYPITFERGFNSDVVMSRSKYIVLCEFMGSKDVTVHGFNITKARYKIIESYKGNLKKNAIITVGEMRNFAGSTIERKEFDSNIGAKRTILFLTKKTKDGDFILTGLYKGFVPLEKESGEWKIPKRFINKFATHLHKHLHSDRTVKNFSKIFAKAIRQSDKGDK